MSEPKRPFAIGTPTGTLLWAVSGLTAAVLVMTLGFWKALIAAAVTVVFGFIGGVKHKKDFFRKVINALIPQKKTVAFKLRNEKVEKALQAIHEKELQENAAEKEAQENTAEKE